MLFLGGVIGAYLGNNRYSSTAIELTELLTEITNQNSSEDLSINVSSRSYLVARRHLHAAIHHIYLMQPGVGDVLVYVDRLGIAAHLGLRLLHGRLDLRLRGMALDLHLNGVCLSPVHFVR